MTFMHSVDGELVPGAEMPWQRPWAFRCDDCGRLLPYGVALYGNDKRTSRDQARCISQSERPGTHRCGDCDGFTEQQGLWAPPGAA